HLAKRMVCGGDPFAVAELSPENQAFLAEFLCAGPLSGPDHDLDQGVESRRDPPLVSERSPGRQALLQERSSGGEIAQMLHGATHGSEGSRRTARVTQLAPDSQTRFAQGVRRRIVAEVEGQLSRRIERPRPTPSLQRVSLGPT